MGKDISFSEYIKNEIMEYNWSKDQWRILFYAFLRTNGTFKNGKYVVTTTLKKWEKKFDDLFFENYGFKPESIHLKKILKYEIKNSVFLENFAEELGSLLVNSLDENKAYVAGIFLGKGWINEPTSKFYHFEIRVRHLQHSLDVQEAFDGLGIKTNTIKKNKWFYTYVKKASEISKIISSLNAFQAVMLFEDSRIERDFISSFKKMESIEAYNLKKQNISAKKQIDIINNIKNKPIINSLTTKQFNLMNLRLEKPSYSLSELQMEYNFIYDENVSKSTINNWLRKIISLENEIEDLGV